LIQPTISGSQAVNNNSASSSQNASWARIVQLRLDGGSKTLIFDKNSLLGIQWQPKIALIIIFTAT
jgi:hypothetical protein